MNECDWVLKKHPSIGTRIATYFPKAKKTYIGEVAAVSKEPPIIYRIVYEDGDCADFDEDQLKNGIRQKLTHCREIAERSGWIFTHESIGLHVAAKFTIVVHYPTKTTAINKLYEGEVMMFAPATDDSQPMWHIRWEDGDEEDYDQEQFEKGVKMWKAHQSKTATQDNQCLKVKRTAKEHNPNKRAKQCDAVFSVGTCSEVQLTTPAAIVSSSSSSSTSSSIVADSAARLKGYATFGELYAARRFKR